MLPEIQNIQQDLQKINDKIYLHWFIKKIIKIMKLRFTTI